MQLKSEFNENINSIEILKGAQIHYRVCLLRGLMGGRYIFHATPSFDHLRLYFKRSHISNELL